MEKERGVDKKMESQASVSFFFLVQKISQNFALCTCPKPKVDVFDPK